MVKIDNDKCDGCGLCVPNCHEGALQIIDGKARLISDLMCDGLGACIGHCPQGAITIEKREAMPYDEIKVLKDNIIPAGKNVLKAHLEHLHEHGETEYLNEALNFLKSENINIPDYKAVKLCSSGGCPGSAIKEIKRESDDSVNAETPSELTQWPVQLHLANPAATYFKNADLLVAADCTAFTIGNFHSKYLKGKKLVIACPKLDSNQDVYLRKIKALIDQAEINTLTVMIMEVPCCGGLVQLVKNAVNDSKRKVPVKLIIVGIEGVIKKNEWI